MSRTLGQQRAEYCLEMLKDLKCDRSEFKALTAGLPAMILQNGFGQTLAYLLNKATKKEGGQIVLKTDDKHYEAFKITTEWLKRQNIISNNTSEKAKLIAISQMQQKDYLHAQRETLFMLEWLKRYANAALFT